jgi:hypothetical protein
MPGEHTLRATLDGYEEAVQTFTAKPGEEITVTLRLLPNPEIRPSDQTERIIETLLQKKRRFPPPFNGSNVWGRPDYDPKEDPDHGEPKEKKPVQKKDGPRFSINGGVVTVFGVASWSPAVGGVVGVRLRANDYFSLGLEGRAAWLTTQVVPESQINAMTGGGIVSACGHLQWFFGCALGHIGAMNVVFSDRAYTGKSYTDARLGFGGRIGGQFHVSESVVLIGSIDALKLSSGSQVFVGNQKLVDIPPVFVGGQISGGWEF